MVCCILCGGRISQPTATFCGNERSKVTVVRFVVRIFLELDIPGGCRVIDELCNSWNTCLECSEMIQESFEIYRQLVKLTEKFRRNRKEIADKCKRLNHTSKNYRGSQAGKTFHQAILNASDDFSAPFLLVDPQTFLKEVLVTLPEQDQLLHAENTRPCKVNSPNLEPTNFQTQDSIQSEGLSIHVEPVKEEVKTAEENSNKNLNFKSHDSSLSSKLDVQNDEQNDETSSSTRQNHLKVSVKRARKRLSNRPLSEPVKPKRPRKTVPKLKPESIKIKRKDVLLQMELQRNPDSGLFQCPSCDYTNLRGDYVKEHYGRHHLDKSQRPHYSCDWPDCVRSFFNRESYQSHMDQHNKTPRFDCKQCSKSFYRTTALTYHRQLDHEGGRHEKKFTCEKCGRGYGTQASLHCHKYQNHSTKKRLNAALNTRKIDKIHTKPSSEDTQICQLCGKTLTVLSFKIHMWNVHRDESFSKGILKCPECQYGFRNKDTLDIHMYSKHKIGDPCVVPTRKKYEWHCDVQGCRARFHKEDNYKSHMDELHGPDKKKPGPFQCQFCGRRFFRQSRHEFHELSHKNSESKPFPCETCGKGFPTMAYLRYHLVHTHKLEMENRRGFRHLKHQLTTDINMN